VFDAVRNGAGRGVGPGAGRRAAVGVALATFAFLAVPPAPARAQDAPGPRAITLDEALEMARRNAPAAIQAEGRLRTGRARVRSSYAAFLPSLNLSAGSTRQFDRGGGTRIENGTVVTLPSTPWSYSAGMSAGLTLFQGGGRFFDLRQAKADLTAAEASGIAQRYLVDLEVKRQYYNVLAARETEIAAHAQLEQAEQQLRAAVLRLRAARATKSDSLRSDIQLRNAQLALGQAQVDLETANAALTRAVGVNDPVTAAPAGDSDEAPAPDMDALEAGLEDTPSVREARAQLTAARAARATAWTDYLPSVSASYNRGGSGSGSDVLFGADDLTYNGTFRLSLSMPIFDRLGREEAVVQRGVAADNAAAALRDARLAAREDLTRYAGALRTATDRVQANAVSVTAAEEDLRVQQQRYALGESTLLDVLTSQTQLNDARAALIRARYDQRIARAQLEALIGSDL